ncbi:thioredoxin family protein [Ornithinibacillus gellani]|uniref:thioredoxin family protein n=1 Tax=Ornithinibacillus gellani TaxID=2293253 RepID=UPI000F47DB12|nr:thioredoxin family protein [Ornithinibacillus gellani]TQS74942.1 thioredoxin family protein [Ornithinibacillus gellani]
MQLNDWFEKGLTPEAYIETLDKHADNFQHIANHFQLPQDEAFFSDTKSKNLRIVAIVEEWCGHCMLNIPILLQLAEKTGIDVRFLPRDANLELMDQYQTDGKRIIPIFIFIDELGNEQAVWGPRAKTTKQFIDTLQKDMPAKDDPAYEEAFKLMIKVSSKAFRENQALWNGVYDSLKETMEAI